MVRWLYERAWISAESPSVLFDVTTAQLLENKILLPGVTTLAKLISSVRERVQHRLYIKLSSLPSQWQIEELESLLKVTKNNRQSLLEQWRKSPTHSSSNSLVKALNKLENISALAIGTLKVSKIPIIRLKSLAQTAFTVRIQAITRMANVKRIAILVAFVYTLEATAIDDILTILELLVKDLFNELTSKRVNDRYFGL